MASKKFGDVRKPGISALCGHERTMLLNQPAKKNVHKEKKLMWQITYRPHLARAWTMKQQQTQEESETWNTTSL
jgi:hypothetical protein